MEYGSPEWIERIVKRPPTPREIYVDKVQDAFEMISGESFWYVIETETETDKEKCDFQHTLEIIHDCFEDKTTVLDAANMIVDFCKAHKYL